MTKQYLKDTYLIKNSPENTGLLPSDKFHLTGKRKQPINPLRTIFNNTFTAGAMKELLNNNKKGKVDIAYIQEHQAGIMEAYSNYYGEEWEQVLQEELERSKDFLGTGLQKYGEKSPRSIPITQQQWDNYIANGGYDDHCFSCEARPDILIFDFDYKLKEDQIQKIQKAFKKYLWVIERNLDKQKDNDGKCKYGNTHWYIQCDDNTAITKVKAGLKENKEDTEVLDIDIFKGGLKHVAGTTPSRKYKILYDGEPTSSISPRKAITLLSKTLNCYLDKNVLEEILQPKSTHKPTTTTTKTSKGEITVTANTVEDNERYTTIVENAIPIFTKLKGNGIREELYKSLTGALLKHGFNNAATRQIMTQIYNNTDDKDPRLTTVENAIIRYQEDPKKISGWSVFPKIVKNHNNKKLGLGGNLQRIADSIFLNQPPVLQRVNPETEVVETAVLLANNEEQIFTDYPENEKVLYIITNDYSDYKLVVDYTQKIIAKRITKADKKGNKTQEDTLIITAVPINLIVYNDTICNTGRQYKCTWTFNDGTELEVIGDILKHTKTLQKGAGVWNKNQLQNTISAVFGDLSRTKGHGTVIKNTPKQKGFYYDKENEEIIVVDHEIKRPTPEQLLEALELLDTYSSFFGYGYYNPKEPRGIGWIPDPKNPNEKMQTFKVDPTRLAVFLRWCLNAPFHYVRKQFGLTNDQYIFLAGESGVGKTYGYLQAGLFMLGIEEPKEYIVSGGSNSKAQISKNLAKTTFPVLLDEGDRIINKENLTSMIKHSVQGLNSREVTDTETNELTKEKALAPLGFSANNNFDDTEKGGLTNRMIILPFYAKDVPTPERKELFENEFHTYYTPEDKRRVLKWIGYEFQARIMEDPKVYIKQKPDQVVKDFFTDICHEVGYVEPLEWINKDIDHRTAEDDLKERHENLMDIIQTLLNKEMKVVVIKEDPESYNQKYLIDDFTLTPKEKILHLAESNKVSWLHTNKRRKCLLISQGILRAIKREDPQINISTLKELQDILVTAKYGLYDINRYSINEKGISKQKTNQLKIDVEVLSDLYELEDEPED